MLLIKLTSPRLLMPSLKFSVALMALKWPPSATFSAPLVTLTVMPVVTSTDVPAATSRSLAVTSSVPLLRIRFSGLAIALAENEPPASTSGALIVATPSTTSERLLPSGAAISSAASRPASKVWSFLIRIVPALNEMPPAPEKGPASIVSAVTEPPLMLSTPVFVTENVSSTTSAMSPSNVSDPANGRLMAVPVLPLIAVAVCRWTVPPVQLN